MEQTNNIVIFPKINNRIELPTSKEEVNEILEENKSYHIQQTLDFITPMLFSHLNIAGFSPNEDEKSVKEGAFIVEAIRSHMYSHYGMKHPFQNLVEKVFIKEEGDPEGVLTIAKQIKAVLSE